MKHTFIGMILVVSLLVFQAYSHDHGDNHDGHNNFEHNHDGHNDVHDINHIGNYKIKHDDTHNNHEQENQHEHLHDHNCDHSHEHDAQHNYAYDPKHSHSHSHSHSHNENKYDHQQDNQIQFLQSLGSWTQDIKKLTFASVLIVSLPSIPTFFTLTLVQYKLIIIIQKIQKFFGGNKKELISNNLISKLIAFSFGTLIGDVFLHILPHLLEGLLLDQFIIIGHMHEKHGSDHNHNHQHEHSFEQLKFYFYILGGIAFFITVDFLSIRIYQVDEPTVSNQHSHSHTHKKVENVKETKKEDKEVVAQQTSNEKAQVLVFLFGDFLHNLTDGIALGASYSYSFKIGISTTLAILMHETPHEIGDFAYLIKKKYSLKGILATQFITSMGCLFGSFIGLYFGEIYKEELLSLTAGGFLYMCLSGIFPDIRESFQTTKGSFVHFIITMMFILAGVLIMYAVTFIE